MHKKEQLNEGNGFLDLTVDLLKDFVLPVMVHHNCQFQVLYLIDDAATNIFYSP